MATVAGPTIAPALWGIPVVQSTTDRGQQFPTPATDQRVFNKTTGCIERWSGTVWITDVETTAAVLPASGRTVATLASYLANNATFTLKDFGAFGDNAHDDTTFLQAAINAARAAGGGRIFVPPGKYLFSSLDFSSTNATPLRSIVLYGSGAGGSDGGAATESELICTRTDAVTAISLASAQGVTFENIRIRVLNNAYTGTLIKTGWSSANADPAHLVFNRCRLIGATGTAALLDLERAIEVTVRDTAFFGGVRHIIGRQTVYSNVVLIQGCEFSQSSAVPILGPGESWTIQSCTFEGLSSGKAGAVEYNNATNQLAFSYIGNWHGDVTVAGNPWLKLNPVGATIVGNEFAMWTGDDGIDLDYAQGCLIAGNKFLSAGGGAFNAINATAVIAANALGVVIIANDFTGVTGTIIRNQANMARPVILGNAGLNALTVIGSREASPGLASVITQLAATGLVIDGTSQNAVTTLTQNSTTPDVTGGTAFQTNNSSGTAITNLTGGVNGQRITIAITDANTSFVNGANLKLQAATNFAPAAGNATITLLFNGGIWLEVSRSKNS